MTIDSVAMDQDAFGDLIDRTKLDMRFGNPKFLHDFWSKQSPPVEKFKANGLSYSFYVYPELARLINEIHQQHNNAHTTGKHLVIGCGGTQLVMAALWAFKYNNKVTNIYTGSDYYYCRFQQMVDLLGMTLNDPYGKQSAVLLTIPNNPDGDTISESYYPFEIHDLVYNWTQYGVTKKYDKDIMIFGLSKATGHAGVRFGWALVEDRKIADLMNSYVEFTTGGASSVAQERAINILSHVIKDRTVFSFATRCLMSRWEIITQFEVKSNKFTIENKTHGMFLWLKNADGCDILQEANIAGVNGKFFGATEQHRRINMGCSASEFKEFTDRLRKVL